MRIDNKRDSAIQEVARWATVIYAAIILCIYPLVYGQGYQNIFRVKSNFFWYCSIAYVILIAIPLVSRHRKNRACSGADVCAALLGVITLCSWLINSNKIDTFWGTYGRGMGLVSIFLCMIIYYGTSRYQGMNQWILLGTMATASIVSILAVFNNLGIDILNMNAGEIRTSSFISTMGNLNCYAAYIGILLPFFMVLYLFCESVLSQRIYGFFCLFGMAGIVVSGSDSPYLTVGLTVLFLLFSGKTKEQYKRIGILLVEYALVHGGIGVLRDIRGMEQVMILRGLPKLMIDWRVEVVIVLVGALLWGLGTARTRKEQDIEQTISRLKKIGLAVLVSSIVLLAAVLLWVNLFMDVHQAKAAFGGWYQYLYLSNSWGTNRIKIWHAAITIYGRMPWKNKLFGCGPAGFYFASQQYLTEQELAVFDWGTLLDAHNEYLQYLITVGILGVLAYLGIMIFALITCCRNKGKSSNSKAFTILIVAFMIQACLNNAHIYIEPIMFMLLGSGMNIVNKRE